MNDINPELLDKLSADPELQRLIAAAEHPLHTFQPRPDRPELFDEQQGFVDSQSVISVCLGGNGSGKSTSAAFKAARFLLIQQEAARRDHPFWVISNSLWNVGSICWIQGLSRFIPHELIDWPRVRYFSSKLDWPSHVPLLPRPGSNTNWMIEFRSTESGRAKFEGISVGGAYFSEQFDWPILLETLRGLRDSWYPGSVILEMTPIDPDLSIELEALYDDPPEDWAFFRLNTELNDAVSDDWKKSFFAAVSDEQQETRKTGAFASFQGVIYPSFNPKINLVGDDIITHPPNVFYRRGIDWGESAEHPFVILWAYKDGSGNWFVFDEFVDHEGLLYEHRCDIIRDRHPWPHNSPFHGMAYADPSRPGLINEFNMRGIPCCSALNAVHPGIEHVRSLLKIQENTGQPKLFIHKDNCPVLARQMRTYRWLRSSGKGLNPRAALQAPLKARDDTVDSLRYMLFSDDKNSGSVPSSMVREARVDRARRLGVRFQYPTDNQGRLRNWPDIWRHGFSSRRN